MPPALSLKQIPKEFVARDQIVGDYNAPRNFMSIPTKHPDEDKKASARSLRSLRKVSEKE